ncbi:MAG: outer-membrane lipoprotein carrier protein LolA [Acidobacteria bacterium]|nr:outer-membrane lipoprotein carrier protein LolA [Acidobacteriota bacterium]
MRRDGLLVAVVLALSVALPMHAAGEAAARVTAVLRSCEGNSAQFVHKFLPKGYKKETIEQGSVVFGPLPSMRWRYTTPETKEFVFDGTTSWLWVPADRQVTVHELTPDERAALPFFALSDPARIESSFTVTKSGRKTTLKSRKPDGMLAEIVVEEGKDGRLSLLRYVDSQGNRTSFELTRFVPSASGPESFRFVAPPGADIVRN